MTPNPSKKARRQAATNTTSYLGGIHTTTAKSNTASGKPKHRLPRAPSPQIDAADDWAGWQSDYDPEGQWEDCGKKKKKKTKHATGVNYRRKLGRSVCEEDEVRVAVTEQEVKDVELDKDDRDGEMTKELEPGTLDSGKAQGWEAAGDQAVAGEDGLDWASVEFQFIQAQALMGDSEEEWEVVERMGGHTAAQRRMYSEVLRGLG